MINSRQSENISIDEVTFEPDNKDSKLIQIKSALASLQTILSIFLILNNLCDPQFTNNGDCLDARMNILKWSTSWTRREVRSREPGTRAWISDFTFFSADATSSKDCVVSPGMQCRNWMGHPVIAGGHGLAHVVKRLHNRWCEGR